MRLPKLKVIEDAVLDKSTCQGQDNCPSCPLYVKNNGRCDGCTPKFKEQMVDYMKWCYRECNECAGYNVKVPAICCRSPMKDIYMTAVTKGAEDWNHPSYKYKERERLDFKNKAVFYISSGGVNTIAAGGKPLIEGSPEIVAVNITRVWSGNGFYSKDLKDYLHLPRSTKLVLMTMCLDDLLERAWEKEFYADPAEYRKVGIDYWMPLSFSGYPKEAHMQQYYQLLRTLYCTEKSKAWFATGDHNFPGIRTDDLVLDVVKHIPQMIFNMQFVVDDEMFKYHLRFIKHYHQLVPKDVAFWMVGSATPTFLHNVRMHCGKRDIYYLSAKPLYLASKGQGLNITGKNVGSDLPKWELLQANINAFTKTVKEYG